MVGLTTSDGHGGKLTCVTEEEADPTGPCYDSEQAIAAFRLLARAGGALFSPQRVDTMGVVGQHDPEALWGLFLFSRLQDAPSGFTSEQGEGESHMTVLRNPFAASIRAIKIEDPSSEPSDDAAQTDWRDVQERLLSLRGQGERYTTQQDLARRLGCSGATINKAINDSDTLKGWMARHRESKASPRATSLNEVIADNAEQTREPGPADALPDEDVDNALARLIEQAEPSERARLSNMSPEQRREVARLFLEQTKEPDSEPPDLSAGKPRRNRLLGRKP